MDLLPYLSFFRVQPTFLPSLLHNLLLLQHRLMRMCSVAMGLFHLVQLPIVAVNMYIKTSRRTIPINMRFNKTLNNHTLWQTYIYNLGEFSLLFPPSFIFISIFTCYSVCIWFFMFCNYRPWFTLFSYSSYVCL